MSNTTPIPNTVTKTLLCVDSVENEDFSGTLYNPYLPEPVPYGQAKEAIDILDTFFNDISYPQSFFQYRSFMNNKRVPDSPEPVQKEIRRYSEDSIFDAHKGKIATFIVEVKFRQNVTWQGELIWKENGKIMPFLSTLEMLRLIIGVLDEAAAAEK